MNRSKRRVPRATTVALSLQVRASTLSQELLAAQQAIARVAAGMRDLENDLADLVELEDGLRSLAEATGASPIPKNHKRLDVAGRQDQFHLDGEPLVWLHGDGRPRPIARGTEAGRLLIDLVNEEPLDEWPPQALSRALQQLRRCPVLGRDGVVGRGRELRLAVPVRMAPDLLLSEAGRSAARGRAKRERARP